MRVMVVDDENPCLDELTYMISRFEGIEIVGAFTSPFDALAEAVRLKPDTVFLDISMPNLNGLELAKKILAQDSTIRIVFITAYTKEFSGAKDFPAFGCLFKPISRQKLADLFNRLKECS